MFYNCRKIKMVKLLCKKIHVITLFCTFDENFITSNISSLIYPYSQEKSLEIYQD